MRRCVLARREARSGKKLIEAAQYWAGLRSNGTPVEDEDEQADNFDLAEQLAKAGAPVAVIQAVQERAAEDVPKEEERFDLWEESLPTWNFFQSLCKMGQWDYAIGQASAHRLGIPAERVTAMMEAKGIKKKERARLFSEIEEMVHAVRIADARLAQLKRDKDNGQRS